MVCRPAIVKVDATSETVIGYMHTLDVMPVLIVHYFEIPVAWQLQVDHCCGQPVAMFLN